MPARIHGGLHGCEGPRRQALRDPNDWGRQIHQAAVGGRQRLESSDMLQLIGNTDTKLSVREQAKQFEQQALQEQTLKRSRDSQGSLSSILFRDGKSDDILELNSETLLSILDHSYDPMSLGRDVPPRIVNSQGEDPQTSTPPVLRSFTSSISSYASIQPYQITVEVIPDPPENPPPPPPQQPYPSSPPTSPPSSPPSSLTLPSYHQKPQLNPQPPYPSPVNKHIAPPTPPPLPPPPSPTSDQLNPVAQFVPASLPPMSSLRPVSERKIPPPPQPSQTDMVRKTKLKGILKNIQNLADIERSVANMYSQVDKNCKLPKFDIKPQVAEELEDAKKLQSSDPWDEHSIPKTATQTSSLVQVDSTVMNCIEDESLLLNMAAEEPQTNQSKSSPNTTELSEQFSSQSTVF